MTPKIKSRLVKYLLKMFPTQKGYITTTASQTVLNSPLGRSRKTRWGWKL